MVEQVSASKKLQKDDALKLAKEASKIFIAQGKKVLEFKKDFDEALFLAAALGRTGNLRAPSIVRGKSLYIGFPKEGFDSLR